MDSVQATLSHQEAFFNKKIFSNKIHNRILKVRLEISKALDNFKISNDDDKRLFRNAVNHYFHDLCAVIFHLRQVVIKINEDDQGVHDLQNVITGLIKTANLIQDFLNLGIEELIIQLKGSIADVGSQVEKLMKIIEYDNLHEHKQEVLDCQHDLGISVESLKLYCQFAYLPPPELERLNHEEIQKVKNNLMKINTGHEHLVGEFAHYTRHSVNNFQNAANYLKKMINTGNFQNDLESAFKIADVCGTELTSRLLEALRDDNPIRKMLDAIENYHDIVIKGSTALQNGIQNPMKKNIGKKDAEQAKQLMCHIFINGMNSMSALNQSIEDAIAKK